MSASELFIRARRFLPVLTFRRRTRPGRCQRLGNIIAGSPSRSSGLAARYLQETSVTCSRVARSGLQVPDDAIQREVDFCVIVQHVLVPMAYVVDRGSTVDGHFMEAGDVPLRRRLVSLAPLVDVVAGEERCRRHLGGERKTR